MQIKFVDFYKQHQKYKLEIEQAIDDCISRGAFILQKDVEEFEENLAQFVGTEYAIGVNSGTDALFLSLKMAGIKERDEVITVGHTFHATVEAIVHCGARPVLVNVGYDGQMSVKEALSAVNERTKAIIPVHLMGDMVDMHTLTKDIPDNIFIIEDACQAFGAERSNKKAGSRGFAGCFSFYPAKILGAYGDAGAITTNDEELAQELKDLRNHYKYNPGKYGYNSRLDNIQAAILNVKLNHIDEILSRRKEVAEMYDLGLLNAGLPSDKLGRVYQDYVIKTDKRDELARYLKDKGIETLKNDYHFPDDLPKPEKTIELESQTLRLPCNDVLTDDEVNYVIEKVNEFT